MSFNWNEFYFLAEHLNDDFSIACQEAAQRTVVSRAYYAAFCMAKEVAKHKYKITFQENVDDHRVVCRTYANLGRIDISESLFILRKFRNMCDYKNDVQNVNKLADRSLKMANEIILKL